MTSQGFPALGPVRVSPELAPWLRIWAVSRRHAYVLLRSPHRLFDVTVWPIVDTVLFGSLGVFFARQGGPDSAAQAGVAYLLSGIVLWHVVYQAQIAVSTGFMEETWSRNLLSLMVTPLRELELVAGIALFGLAKLVMGVGVVALAAFAFYAFDVTTLGLGLVPPIIALVLLAIPPILSGTYAGVANVAPALKDAGAAMGMTGSQVLTRVEVPNARIPNPAPCAPTLIRLISFFSA